MEGNPAFGFRDQDLELNLDHPLAEYTIGLWVPDAWGLRNAASPRHWAVLGNGSSSATKPSLVWSQESALRTQIGYDYDSGHCIHVPNSHNIHDFSKDHSGFVDYKSDNNSSSYTIVGKRDGTAVDWQFYKVNSGIFARIGGDFNSLGTHGTDAGVIYGWRRTASPNTVSLYINGAIGSGGTVAFTGTPNGGSNNYIFGANWLSAPSISFSLEGIFFASALFDRDVGEDWLERLTAGEWTDMLWQPRRSYFLPPPPSDSRVAMVSVTGSMTTDGDVIEIRAPTNASLVLHRIALTQSSDAGEGQNEQLTVTLKRITGSPIAGSGGTTITPVSLQGDNPVSGGTYVGFNTTPLSGGTQAAIHTESFNIELGMNRIWTYKTRPVISPGTYALLTLDAAPFNSITFQVTVYFEGIGG